MLATTGGWMISSGMLPTFSVVLVLDPLQAGAIAAGVLAASVAGMVWAGIGRSRRLPFVRPQARLFTDSHLPAANCR